MALKNDRYTYRVTWSEGDHEYVGLCAELPSLSWLAKTPEAALKGIRKVVADMVDKKKHNIKWDVSSSLISWTDPLSAY
jgi:predicted RNase H-like HicB family nuclease